MDKRIVVGTRGSPLARWQTEYVRRLLHDAWPVLHSTTRQVVTTGDQVLDLPLPLIGGKGLFTAELEAALRSGTIDLAVHSLKDLPTDLPPDLPIGAVPPRVDAADVIVSRAGYTMDSLPKGATVGTSSRRRAAQLLHYRPDLVLADIRGTLETRIRKALDPAGPYSAIMLAHAGLERMGYTGLITELLAHERMLPAPGQGALGVQCRDDHEIHALVAPINHAATALAVAAERAFLHGLGGGCAVPIGAYAVAKDERLTLRGRITAPDGGIQIDLVAHTTLGGGSGLVDAARLGAELAQAALEQGAGALVAVTL